MEIVSTTDYPPPLEERNLLQNNSFQRVFVPQSGYIIEEVPI